MSEPQPATDQETVTITLTKDQSMTLMATALQLSFTQNHKSSREAFYALAIDLKNQRKERGWF